MNEPDLNRITKAVTDTLSGNPDAYTEIVTAYMQKLYRTARSVCGNDTVAEDLVQETLIDGYLRLSSLREPEKIEGWLTRILKNKAFNYLTRTRPTEPEEIPDTLADPNCPETVYITGETMREWKRRISSLSPALRETAILYFWYNLSMDTIARRTNAPIGTVKRRIHDARVKLKKENTMSNEKHILPDSFATELAVKIRDLENYTKTYSTSAGFDAAYKFVKELIGNLSDSNDAKTYSVKSAEIAAKTDMDKYAEETLAVYRKYGEAENAQNLLLKLCWKIDGDAARLSYTRDTVIPMLEEYPDSEEKFAALGCHLFWMAYYADKSTPEGIAEARSYLNEAMDAYSRTATADASYANTVAGLKGLDALEDNRVQRYITVTGETWKITDGNICLYDEPGCSYVNDGSLFKFQNYIFMNAGYSGDGYFFSRAVPIEPGREETMVNSNGKKVGIRRIHSLDETVSTPAGVFTNCLHLEKIDEDGEQFHMWYKDKVGLVKISSSNSLITKVLTSYELCGGDGWLPLAVGNKWIYGNPDKPDFMHDRHEYVVERMGIHPHVGESVCVSALNYIALEKDWDAKADDPVILLSSISHLCDKKKYSEAAEKLREIVMLNRSRESVDIALAVLEYLEEKLPYDEQNWRFCPSSANISAVEVTNGRIRYGEGECDSFDTGVWGTRHQENRIFGVKPFRYLGILCGTLWDDRWIPGYTDEYAHGWKDGKITLTVDNGGTIITPAGEFTDTVHLTVNCDANGNGGYFYDHTDCGIKEYWFVKGVGIVRFKCTWGTDLESDCLLTEYRTVAGKDEMMPIHIGNRWRYDEQYLTAENYIARRDYKILSGNNDRYLMADSQMFTWRGSVDEYENWKKTL